MFRFKTVATLAAIATAILFVTFAFFPFLPFTLFGVAMEPEGLLMARRMAALFLGMSLLMTLARNAGNSELRRSICLAFAIAMVVIALFGIYDFISGNVGYGIWAAIAVECFFAIALGLHARNASIE